MGKTKCKCGLLAHVIIKEKAYCLKCAPKPEPKPEKAVKPKERPKPPANRVIKKNKQSIESCIDKIGPKIKPTPPTPPKKKPWWKRLFGI